jgi:hypothetical protein
MRSLMIKHATKITAINPSAARFAPDEMLRLVLVGISTLCNVFAAGNLHSSLSSFRRPQCVPYAMSLADRWSRITCKRYAALPRQCGAGRSLKPRDYYCGIARFVFSFQSVLLRILRQFLRR